MTVAVGFLLCLGLGLLPVVISVLTHWPGRRPAARENDRYQPRT